MRKILLLLFMCISTCVWSQEVDKKDSLIQYCLVMYNARNEALIMDMHTNATYFIVNESNGRIIFDSSIALLNFMAEHEWIYKEHFYDRNWGGSTMPCFLFFKRGRKGDDWFKNIRLQKND